MKKYRLTKINVRTREIVCAPKAGRDESQNSVCPVCRTPLAVSLSPAENPAAPTAPPALTGEPDNK